MTDNSRWHAGLAISLFLHFMVFQTHWNFSAFKGAASSQAAQQIHSAAPRIADELTVALETASEEAAKPEGADKSVQERREYLEAVHQAIHARRFLSPAASKKFIGLALYAFTIAPDGSFQNIRLQESSGNAALDADAREALHRASGVIKRPPSITQGEISLVLPVKYQYSL